MKPLPAALVTGPPLLAAIAAWSPLWLAAATIGAALLLAAAPPPRRLYAVTAIGSGLVVFAINPFVSVQGLTVLWQGPHIPILDTQITVEEVAYGAGAGMRVAASALAVAAFVRLADPDLLLRAFSRAERALLRARDVAIRAATRASAAITPRRAVAGVVIASAALLIVAQFIDYRGVEVGQPGYAGLTITSPPTKAVRTAGQAHAYLLVPVALLAALIAAMTMRSERRGLGRIVIALGALSVAVILLVDLPAGLDAGAQTSYFSGATAVLEDGFYAELAAAVGLLIDEALRSFDAVSGAGLLAVGDPGRVEGAADDLVADARQILDSTTPDQDNRVLLQVVALARDVGGDLHPVGETDTGDLAQRRVRLLRRHRGDTGADAAPLRGGYALLATLAGLESGRRGLLLRALAALPDELVRIRHGRA